jgi:hypothetical protein
MSKLRRHGRRDASSRLSILVFSLVTTTLDSPSAMAEDVERQDVVATEENVELGERGSRKSREDRSRAVSKNPSARHRQFPFADGPFVLLLEERPVGEAAKPKEPLKVGARVYVRDTLSGIEVGGETLWREQRTLESGRVFVDYRSTDKLRMSLEVDFAGGDAELKDTFIRYRFAPALDVIAGRFKRPVSFIGLESSWSLPQIERGLLSELRIDDQRVSFAGGRADGLALEIALPGAFEPRVSLALFENDISRDLGIPITEALNQDVFGRAELEPVQGLHLAVAGGWVASLHRRGGAESYRHRPFGSIEGALEATWLRLWLEGMGGLNASVYVDGAQVGRFAAARGLVAPRLTRLGHLRALEPFASFSWYEPSTHQKDDEMFEIMGGVALTLSRHLRLQVEGGRRFAEDAGPAADATLFRIQRGAAFKTSTNMR